MQCERCGLQIDTDTTQAGSLAVQCSRCGFVVGPQAEAQAVFVLAPDDSDVFSLDDKTRVDKPALKQEASLGRVATRPKSPSLGDMLFLDAAAPTEAPKNQDEPRQPGITKNDEMSHFDTDSRPGALELPGIESTAPHRLPASARGGRRVDDPILRISPHPKVDRPQEKLPVKASLRGALIGATITLVTLVVLGVGLVRLIFGLTPPTTLHGITQLTSALQGGQATPLSTEGIIVSSFTSVSYPTGSQTPVLLIMGEVENHREYDMPNMVVEAQLVDELGTTVGKEQMPVGVEFSPTDFAGLQNIENLSAMIAIKSQGASGVIPALSSKAWSVVMPLPLTDLKHLEHRISLRQKETP